MSLTEDQVGLKLAGCLGVSMDAVLTSLHHGEKLSRFVKGWYFAADGTKTEEIVLKELECGILVHSEATGDDLPASKGGPLRVVYPQGVAVQSAICGTPKAVNLKGVVRLSLLSSNGSGLARDDDSDSD